jgi:mono/diheme cytochrome c family protein
MIRFNQPDIKLEDLWVLIGRFPFPLKQNKVAFAAMRLSSRKGEKDKRQNSNFVPRPRSKKYIEQHMKDLEEGNCFTCHTPGHTTYQCTKQKEPSKDESKTEQESLPKKEKEKSKPRSYAY